MAHVDGSTHDFGLALETSCLGGGIALGCGDRVLETRAFQGPRTLAGEVLAAVADACRSRGVSPAAIGTVFVSGGPGSFTGLRIGITIARHLALATGAKTVAVPTLQVIAHNALRADPTPARVIPMLDAKRRRVYAAAFELRDHRYVLVEGPAEVEPADFLARRPEPCAILGEGVGPYRDLAETLGHVSLPDAFGSPSPLVLYEIGLQYAREGVYVPPRMLVPLYVRRPEAEERWEQRFAGR